MIRHIPFNFVHKGVSDILKEKQTTNVYDQMTEESVLPCVTFGSFTWKRDGAKAIDISNTSTELHIWSSDMGKKEVEEICNDVAAVLTAWELEADGTGFKCLEQDIDMVEVYEAENAGFHGVITFIAKIQYVGG